MASTNDTHLRRTVISYGIFQALSVLGLYAVTVNLPMIADDLGLRDDQVVIVATVYLLGFAIGLPVSGRLIESYGFARTVSVGLALYALASAATAIAPSVEIMTPLRLLAGAASSVMAVSGAILGARLVGPVQRIAAASMSMSLVALSAFSPLIGGLVGDHLSWRIAVALPVIAFIIGLPMLRAVSKHVPHVAPTGRRLDVVGVALAALATSGLVLAITAGTPVGVRVAAVAVAVGAVAATIRWSSGREGAFIPTAILRNRTLMGGALVGHFVALASAGSYILLPLVLASRYDMGSTTIGLWACVSAVLGAVATILIARSATQRSTGMLAGLIIVGAAGVVLVALDAGGLWVSIAGVALAQLSYGCTHAILLLAAQKAVTAEHSGIGIGTFQTIFYLGGATGSALLATVLESGTLPQAALVIAAVSLLALPALTTLPRFRR